MTKQQMIWASQHDWFVSFSQQGDTFTVQAKTEAVDKDGLVFDDRMETTDYTELREWAGY